MTPLDGFSYHIRGLRLAMRTPKLLFLGMVRFVSVAALTLLCAGLILYYHGEIFGLMWTRPESNWLVWLWHLASWLLTFLLVGLSAVVSYFFSQILFGVVIMDRMSRITEALVRGAEKKPNGASLLGELFHLIRQEALRTLFPVFFTLFLMVLGWFTPLSPIMTILSPAAAAVFLAWDHTDLVPARRLDPFRSRYRFLMKTIPFHLAFGIVLVVPVLNLLFLSFAPIGGTLYYLERQERP